MFLDGFQPEGYGETREGEAAGGEHEDIQALLDVWHPAQRILAGAPGGGRKVASSDKTDGAGGAVKLFERGLS
jgi:hypothetical protein